MGPRQEAWLYPTSLLVTTHTSNKAELFSLFHGFTACADQRHHLSFISRKGASVFYDILHVYCEACHSFLQHKRH